MGASIIDVDFSDPVPGKVWEPGEHEGCPEQEILHLHVTKNGKGYNAYDAPKS